MGENKVSAYCIAKCEKGDSGCHQFDGSLRAECATALEDGHKGSSVKEFDDNGDGCDDGDGGVRKAKKKKGKNSDRQFLLCGIHVDARPLLVYKRRVMKRGRIKEENQQTTCSQHFVEKSVDDESRHSRFDEGSGVEPAKSSRVGDEGNFKTKRRRNNVQISMKEDLSYRIEPLSDGDGKKREQTKKDTAEICVSSYVLNKCVEEENNYSQFDDNLGVEHAYGDEGLKIKQKKRRKAVESSSKEDLKNAIKHLSDGNGKKRKRKKKEKEEIIVSPYFVKNCVKNRYSQIDETMGVDTATLTGDKDKGVKSRRKNRRKDVESNMVEDRSLANMLLSNGDGKKRQRKKEMEEAIVSPYFMKKRVKAKRRISQCDDNTVIESARVLEERDEKNGKSREKKKRMDGDGNKEENLSDEVVHFTIGNLKEEELEVSISTNHESGGARKMENISLDDLFSRFAYTGGKSHNNSAKLSIHQSSLQKVETGEKGKMEDENIKTVKDDLVKDNAVLCRADAVGVQTAIIPHNICENVKEETTVEIERGEMVTQKNRTGSKGCKRARKKVQVVSPYFANGDAKVKVTAKQGKVESKKLHAKKVSPYFCSTEQEVKNKITVSLCGPTNSKVQTRKTKRTKAHTAILTAAQKRDEAYLTITPDNIWRPPRSPFNLLQEDHAFDPWRVLVICMLLNQIWSTDL